MRNGLLMTAAMLMVAGCASAPPIDYQYPPSQGVVAITIVRSVDCSSDGKRLIVVDAAPTVTTQYSANYAVVPLKAEISKTQADLADSDFTFGFYDDGRLKSINGTSTGQGETILKDVISVAATAAMLGGGKPADTEIPECTFLKTVSKDKPISIIYTAAVPLAPPAAGGANPIFTPFASSPASNDLAQQLKAKLPMLGAYLTVSDSDVAPVVPKVPTAKHDDFVWIELQHVRFGTLQLKASGAVFWSGTVLVPGDSSDPIHVPVPKAKVFGKTTTVYAISEAGTVTLNEYSDTKGTASALEVVNGALTAATPKSAADKAADAKADSDLIMENQRKARCIARPDQCT